MDLSAADLRGADLAGAMLSGANPLGIHLHGTNLRGANLANADLRDAILHSADLRGADLSGADLSQADLSHADLGKANLQEADLYKANLRSALLYETNLTGATLIAANLEIAYLCDADLSNARLSHARLVNPRLINANLSGADLTGSTLQAVLNDVRLDGAVLSNISILSTTDLVTNTVWSELKIDGKTYRRDRLHVDPLPFGMGPCLRLSLRFGEITEANWKLLCGVADSMIAGGTSAMVVHQGNTDRFETCTYGVDREIALLQALDAHAEKLQTIGEKIEQLEFFGLSDGQRSRLRSLLLFAEAEQDQRAVQSMNETTERKVLEYGVKTALTVASKGSLSALWHKLIEALGM